MKYPKAVAQLQVPFVGQNLSELQDTKKLDMVILDADPVAQDDYWLLKIKEENPDLKVFVYFSPGDTLTFGDDPKSNPFTAEYRGGLKCEHIVHDHLGNMVPLYYNSNGGASYLVNSTLKEVRDFQVATLVKHLGEKPIDGIYLDWSSPIQFLNTATDPSGVKRFPGQLDLNNDGIPESTIFLNETWAKGHAALTKSLRKCGWDVIGNGGWETSLSFDHLSAIMVENFLDSNKPPGQYGSWGSLAKQMLSYNKIKHPSNAFNFIMANRSNSTDPANLQFFRYAVLTALTWQCGVALQNQNNYTKTFSVDELGVDIVLGRASSSTEHCHYLGKPLLDSAISVVGSLQGKRLIDVVHSLGDLAPIEDNIWRFDYQYGISLINPSTVAKSYTLEKAFRKFKGLSDGITNDGATVTSVTIGPKNGLVLLR